MNCWFTGYLAALLLLAVGETKAQAVAGYKLPEGTPECVPTKFKEFGGALIANAKKCFDKCSEVKIPTPSEASALFKDMDTSRLKTCSGIQTEIMDGICNTNLVSCCEWVVPKFVSVMECIAQDGLKATPQPCRLSCSKTSRRDLESESHDNRELFIDVGDGSAVQPSADAFMNDCASFLDNGSGRMPSADELVTILGNGAMLGCLASTTVKVVAEQVAYEEYRKKTFIDFEWEIPSTGMNLGMGIGILLLVLGCCVFCTSWFCYRRAGKDGYDSD